VQVRCRAVGRCNLPRTPSVDESQIAILGQRVKGSANSKSSEHAVIRGTLWRHSGGGEPLRDASLLSGFAAHSHVFRFDAARVCSSCGYVCCAREPRARAPRAKFTSTHCAKSALSARLRDKPVRKLRYAHVRLYSFGWRFFCAAGVRKTSLSPLLSPLAKPPKSELFYSETRSAGLRLAR